MRDDFCAFILTHGRPDRVRTWSTLRLSGYTGRVFIVIDDEDKRASEYREKFGDSVIQFSKAEAAKTFDEGDNFDDRRAIAYARNVCFDLARERGFKYFIQLDDDYTNFSYRTETKSHSVRGTIDQLLEGMVEFLETSGALTVCMSQGGDFNGGVHPETLRALWRKAMNTFVCSVDRPFKFSGRINEDVNTYTELARRGGLFFTVLQAQMNQLRTQSNAGGMADLYLDSGTYVKSFYSVMYCPSGVRIGHLQDSAHPDSWRVHHNISWNAVAPKILHEKYRKPDA